MKKQELDNQALEAVVGGLDRLQAPEGIGAFSALPLFRNSSPAQVKAWIKEIYEHY